MYFILRYYAFDGTWKNAGWFQLPPNTKAHIASTTNTIYYYYAQDIRGEFKTIGDSTFNINGSSIKLKKEKITSKGWGDWTQYLQCK